MNKSAGFTLVELIITIAIAAIVLVLGVPSFQDTIRNNQLATQTNQFVSALNLARSEAIKRGVRVTLCISADAQNCTADDEHGYEQGWIIFVDPNNKATVDVGEEIIRVFGAIASMGMKVHGNSHIANSISYKANGMTGLADAGTLTLCKAPKARQIVISSTGRVRIQEATC